MPTTWRVLIMDDQHAEDVSAIISGDVVLGADNLIEAELCEDFNQALSRLKKFQIDLIILDLKDDSINVEDEDEDLPGEKVFKQIRKNFFLPVIFHTAYAQKVVAL